MRSIASKRTAILPVLAAASLALATASSSSATSTSGEVKEGPPSATTGNAQAAGTAVLLTGSVNPRKLATSYHFAYGPSDAPYSYTTAEVTIPAGRTEPLKVTVSVGATGTEPMLAGDHYRLFAKNTLGSREGHDRVYTPTVKAKPKTRPTATTIVLPSSFQPTPYGGTFVLTGTLTGTGNAGREVVLQGIPYPYTGRYANVGAFVTTSLGGAFKFTVPDFKVSTRYRVAAVGPSPIYSDILTQLAVERVTLKVRTSPHRKGLVRLYGTVYPAVPGARVEIQLERAPKARTPKAEKPEKASKVEANEENERPATFAPRFATVVKRGTKTLSRFSVVVDVKQSGNYRAFVVMGSGPVASGSSTTVELKAGPAKKS
jgi:hypothetical protein